MSKGDGIRRVIAALWSRSNPSQEVRCKYLQLEPEHISFMIEVKGETMEGEAYQGVKGAIVYSDKATSADVLAYLGLSGAELLDDYEPESEDIERLEQEIARLKLKLCALADEASRCRGSLIQAGHFLLATWHNVHHENLLKAITEAREEEEKRE